MRRLEPCPPMMYAPNCAWCGRFASTKDGAAGIDPRGPPLGGPDFPLVVCPECHPEYGDEMKALRQAETPDDLATLLASEHELVRRRAIEKAEAVTTRLLG